MVVHHAILQTENVRDELNSFMKLRKADMEFCDQ